MTQVKIPYSLLPEDDALWADDMRKVRVITRVCETLLEMNIDSDHYLIIMEEDHIILDFEHSQNALLFKLRLVF